MAFPFRCLSRQERHLACKKSWVLVCLCWRFDRSFARLIAPVVTPTPIILSSDKIQNGDILVPASSGPLGKWPFKRRESESESERERERESN